jgi:hypothetical protein
MFWAASTLPRTIHVGRPSESGVNISVFNVGACFGTADAFHRQPPAIMKALRALANPVLTG